MENLNPNQWGEVKELKFHHKVKRFYYKNLFRKIYTIVIIGLIGANVFSMMKYASFADELVAMGDNTQNEDVQMIMGSVNGDNPSVADVPEGQAGSEVDSSSQASQNDDSTSSRADSDGNEEEGEGSSNDNEIEVDSLADTSEGQTGSEVDSLADTSEGQTGSEVDSLADTSEGQTGSEVDSSADASEGQTGSGEDSSADASEGQTGSDVDSSADASEGQTGSEVDSSLDAQNEETQAESQTLTKAQELQNARKTLNASFIGGTSSYNNLRVSVKAPAGSFPEGTKLVIKPIDKGNAESVAFDISFIYTYSDGSTEELQPLKGKSVQVVFNYEENTLWRDALNQGQELRVKHTHDGDTQDVNYSNNEGNLTIDTDKFSEYEFSLVKGTYNTKSDPSLDIVIEATSTAAEQTITINKYFANDYTVSRCTGCEAEPLTSDTTHTYSTAGTYTITLSLSGADRWRFSAIAKTLVPKNSTTMIGVKITSMPSLADGFGESATAPGDNFFYYFNERGALTSLPDGSFDTSHITTVGDYFFRQFNDEGALTSLPDGSFDTSHITSAGGGFFEHFNNHGLTSLPAGSFRLSTGLTTAGEYFFASFNYGGALTSLPAGSFDTSHITTAGNSFFSSFNYNGKLTSLPDNSFNTENITTAGNSFFSFFNYGGALTSLPDGSFKTENITTAGNSFFSSFNWNGKLTSLPDGSFKTENITTAGNSFFSFFNYGGALTSLPDGSFKTENITTAGYDFFGSFNNNGKLTSLPAGSFDTSHITTAENSFFSFFNYNGALTSLPEGSFKTENITTAGHDFFGSFNNNGKLTSLPAGSFDTSHITTVGNSFFTNFNKSGHITDLPTSFKLTSAAYNKNGAYKNAFNSPEYTLNRNVSELVAGITPPTDDRDTFSDNQPGRCGVDANWLVNLPTNCETDDKITRGEDGSYLVIWSGTQLRVASGNLGGEYYRGWEEPANNNFDDNNTVGVAHNNDWGGGGDTYGNTFDSGNERSERRGPCEEGWHVPSRGELNSLIVAWCNLSTSCNPATDLKHVWDWGENNNLIYIDGTVGGAFKTDFNMNTEKGIWSSSVNYENNAWYLGAKSSSDTVSPGDRTERWNARGVRCFKDTIEDTTYTVKFISEGNTVTSGEVVQGHTYTGEIPDLRGTRDGYRFEGWFLGDEKFDFNTPIMGDITLTAKWNDQYKLITKEDGSQVVIFSGIELRVASGDLAGKYYRGWYEQANNNFDDNNTAGSSHNNEWGGGGDVYANTFDDGNDRSQRQGPCATGWHVPSRGEINSLEIAWCNLSASCNPSTDLKGAWDVGNNENLVYINGSAGNAFKSYFNMSIDGERGGWWTSSIDSDNNAWYLGIRNDNNNQVNPGGRTERWNPLNVRCFKDTIEDSLYTVKFVSVGETVASGKVVQGHAYTGDIPDLRGTREGYRFEGWYLSGEKFDFDTPIMGDITLTAKWNDQYKLITKEDGSKVVIFSGIELRVASGDLAGKYYRGWREPANNNFDDNNTAGSSHNNDWGGGGDIYSNTFDDGNDRSLRRGPCATGWHVPSRGEINSLEIAWCNLSTSCNPATDLKGAWDVGSNANLVYINGSAGNAFKNYFNMSIDGERGGWWTSSIDSENNAWYLGVRNDNNDQVNPGGRTERWNPLNVRCFKDTIEDALYTVKFISEGEIVASGKVVEGYAYTGEIPNLEGSREGYTFGGWLLNDGVFDFETVISNDITLNAKWTPISYTIAFDGNAEDVQGSQSQIDAQYDVDYTAPESSYTRAGHRFTSWNTQPNGSGTLYNTGSTLRNLATVSGQTFTLYAQWSKNQYKVTFYDEDGTTKLGESTVDYGETAVYPHSTPSKPNTPEYTYTFTNWYTSKEGGNVDNLSNVTGNRNVYARYSGLVNQYKVTFYDEDGTTKLGESTVDYGETAVYPNETPTKASTPEYTYTFTNWYTSKEGGNVDNLSNVTGNRNVYARYSGLVNQYKVTFYDEDGTTKLGESTVDYGETAVYPHSTPSKPNTPEYTYTFTNWYTSKEGGNVDNLSNVTGNRNVYARYSSVANQYTVTFDTDGGTAIDPVKLDFGATITYPANPTKNCSAFSGWDIHPQTMPSHDITLKAIWNYTCNNYSGGGKRKSSNKSDNQHGSADVKDNTQGDADKGQKIPELDMDKYDANYSLEQNQAYQFANSNGMTTKSSIADSNMGGSLTRIQAAKMLSYYAVNILGKKPDITQGTKQFDDVPVELDNKYNNGVSLAYQLGIMGQNIGSNRFRPYDEVTRGELVSVLSRMIFGLDDGTGKTKYYEPHMAKLYNEGIISKRDPNMKEKRGNVMLMLMRSVK